MKRLVITLVAVAAFAFSAFAYTQRRSFRGGYPAGVNGSSSGRVSRQAALSESMVPGAGKTTGRKKNIRLVKAEGSFAMECAKGDPIQVELKEPAGFRWMPPPMSGKYTCIIERGAAAKRRTANASGGPGVAVATVRRLSGSTVELTLKLMKIGAGPKAEPEDTLTIGLVAK